MPPNCYQEHTPNPSPPPPPLQPRTQRLSTPVEPPSKNYSSPPRSRSRRHSTAEDQISPTAKLSGGAASEPQFRDVDWGQVGSNTGKMLRDRVSEISKCASDVEKLVDGYLEEHSEMQKKLKIKGDSVSTSSSKSRIPRNCGKPQNATSNTAIESSTAQVQGLKDRVSELEKKIKHMEKHHQKELAEKEKTNLSGIQRMDASHKLEVESLKTQLADVNLKLQNHKTKVESLSGKLDQKARLVYEKDQLQSKIEDHALETELIESKNQQQLLETHKLQSRLQKLVQERDDAIKQGNIMQDEARTLRNIIRNCKYCASVWEFTQHRESIDVSVWYCDIDQDSAYTPPSKVETSLARLQVNDPPSPLATAISGITDSFITENLKLLVDDVEKLCNLVAFRSSYLEFYMKNTDPAYLNDFKICLQNQTLEPEIFLAYLQQEIWHRSLQQYPQNTTTLEENILQTLKLFPAKAAEVNLDYPTVTALISAISNSFSNLFTILSTSDEKNIRISLDLSEAGTSAFDLFPIIRRTDGALLLGHISVKHIEENAIIMPVTPVVYRTHNPFTPDILVQGTAIVYERKRSASIPRTPSTVPGTQIPSSPLPTRPKAQSNPTGAVAEPAPPTPILPSSSEQFPELFTAPPRPCLHRKPKLPLPPLDTTATTATPTNSPVLQRIPKPPPPPPPIPSRNLTFKRRSSVVQAPVINIGNSKPVLEAKDSEAKYIDPPIASSQIKPKDSVTPTANVAKGSHNPIQPVQSNKPTSGTPLAAIWRTLEEMDKKHSSSQ
ncbi:hypothetical protein TWF481_011638 [Arthrobotrys musiformis]|uniref:Uncharacterized protein n=1 Tax=Arthrobotrys musiformis TaxID=47236 RepID=A0AAV9VZ20_9PEZI